jgi:hypothetical protein
MIIFTSIPRSTSQIDQCQHSCQTFNQQSNLNLYLQYLPRIIALDNSLKYRITIIISNISNISSVSYICSGFAYIQKLHVQLSLFIITLKNG